MKTYLVKINEKAYDVLALKEKDKLWFHFNGTTYVREEDIKKFSVKKNGCGEIKAFISGQIQKITVSMGQLVNVGDILLVMYAMKMEYSIKSEIKGVVDEIFVNVGDQVVDDQLLVRVKSSESES